MLPGFRFIIMTLMLSTSVLIFGLGAAAILRATHEEFTSLPSSRTMEQPLPMTFDERFNAAAPPPGPTLSLLRVEPELPAEPPAPVVESTTDKVANLNVQTEAPKLQPVPVKKHVVRRKSRKRLAHIRRARIRAAIARTRMVQRTMPVQSFPFLFGNEGLIPNNEDQLPAKTVPKFKIKRGV